MKFYEVYLGLISRGREIGKTCLQLQAESPFQAALAAERIIDKRYGANVIGHCLRVAPITVDEFLYCNRAAA